MSQEKPEINLEVSAAQEFKKRSEARQSGETLELPSGLVVRCGRPSINKLIASGHIPSEVASALVGSAKGGDTVDLKNFGKLYELQQLVARAAIIAPKIVDEPDYENGEAHIEDFSDIDLGYILEYVQSGVSDLAKFRNV